MSEKIYACLLRLYPSHFREVYGEEALQLYRDRAQDEMGFLPGLRLWLDLLSDLVVSVPRWYRTPPTFVARPCTDGMPSFQMMDETLNPSSLLCGGIASLAISGFMLLLISHGGSHFPLPTHNTQEKAGYSGVIAQPTPTPTLVLFYSPARPAAGTTVSLTATVLAVGTRPTPKGHVRFFDGKTVLNTSGLDHGAVTVEAKLPNIRTHSIHAIYYGDINYRGSSSTGHGK